MIKEQLKGMQVLTKMDIHKQGMQVPTKNGYTQIRHVGTNKTG